MCLIVTEEKADSFTLLQEKIAMKTTNEQIPENEEVLKGKLKSIVKQIKEDEDPDLLNTYKKLIKKTVPITLRAYLAAYLFKKAVEGESPEPLAGGDMQTIFVSIGKNKKVFPRDLSRLFRKSLDLQPRDIGNIKVLDNYSFVDIPQSQAQRAIEIMDGIEFRGKNITVNFARKKEKKPNNRDQKGNRDNRDNRDNRGNRDSRESRDNRENKETRGRGSRGSQQSES
jgi:RNA recognition motif-containing protein